jgi:D-3-phosphoglycerate dehydrogenase
VGFGDIGLSLLDEAPGVEWQFLEGHAPELAPAHIAGYDALLVMAPRIGAATLAGNTQLAVVARFGVGYDNVDVPACTTHGVALTITPDGVRRPVAVSAITLLLALSHKLLIKDKLTREGRWAEKLNYVGQGVTGRTFGVIGLGNIGLEVCKMARPFEMRVVGYDPAPRRGDPRMDGVELLALDELLRVSDFVCICCALTAETRHLINAQRLALMKQTAYLINVGRGPIVDEAALTEALRANRIQGAGLDVFEQEPVDPNNPLLTLENVILSPHAICWTDECFRANGHSACRSMLDAASGREPQNVVNREVLAVESFRAKLANWRRA